MKKEIDYKKFIEYVHEKYKDKYSKDEIEALLNLEEDYNKDSPASVGKNLILNRLLFNGKKISGEEIAFDKVFSNGLNVWIADNGRGKSTIFKIIKYALTGHNNIKKDIKNWIKEIILEFKIGKNVFTIYINKKSRISEGGLYTFNIEKFLKLKDTEKLDTIETNLLFTFKGDEAYENQIQTFFFNQFSYYSLKYTQKSSSKSDLTLKTSSLSWNTYFKTIYLESSDHTNLYFKEEKIGDQGKKIFEMILGLRLTYPINRLTLLLNREDEEIGKIKIIDEVNEKAKTDNKEKLEKELAKINKDFENLEKLNNTNFDVNPLIEEQIKLQNSINSTLSKHREASTKYNEAVSKRDTKHLENLGYRRDYNSVSGEVTRLEKQVLNMNLYQEAGSFFTNLEVKTCPHCETVVTQDKITLEAEQHNCRLCGTEALLQRIDPEEINEKISKIKEEIKGYVTKKKTLEDKIKDGEIVHAKLSEESNNHYKEFVKIPSVDADQNRLTDIARQITTIRSQLNELKDLIGKKDALRDKKAVVTYRLNELNNLTPKKNDEEYQKRLLNKEVLNYAIGGLKLKRQELNKEIIEKLQGLILREIHEFGLKNVSSVEISNSYDLAFIQNDEGVSFEDLTESEKLRVKFAFFLSLIQLDIEYQLGRHTRFLVIDSPGSEEISKANLEGLSTIFKEVNKRFGNDLQIFLGTALREFVDVSSSEKSVIKEQEEYLF